MALFPRRNPILPPQALKLLSRLSMYIFGPALTFYSTSSHLNWERVKASLVLAAFSFFQNVLSSLVARLFRPCHKDERLGRVVEIAVGTPNQVRAEKACVLDDEV